jgi:hypothetical protein
MQIIKISTICDEPLLRQTPNSSGKLGNNKFVINEDIEVCDAWVIFEGLRKIESARCPEDKTFFLLENLQLLEFIQKNF